MRKISTPKSIFFLFETEDFIPIANQMFISIGLRKNFENYEKFCLYSTLEINKLDCFFELDNLTWIYEAIDIQEGKEIIRSFLCLLKNNYETNAYEIIDKKAIVNYLKIFNNPMETCLLMITEQKYILLYWVATP